LAESSQVILIKPGDEDGTIHEEQIIAALKAA
jgi:hypothetical protein